MTYREKNEGKEGALWAAGLSFQECIWLRLMSSQRGAVAGAPALFQGPQGRKRGKRGNRESWARVWLAEVDCVRTGQPDSSGEGLSVRLAQPLSGHSLLPCLLADDGESDGCDRGSEAAESIYRWGHCADLVEFMNSSKSHLKVSEDWVISLDMKNCFLFLLT